MQDRKEEEELSGQPKIKVETLTEKPAANKSSRFRGGVFQGIFEINKWLLSATILTILFAAGLYFWVEITDPQVNQNDVKTLSLEGLYFNDHIKIARISGDTLIGIVNPSYMIERPEKKDEILRNLLTVGKEKGFNSVKLMSPEGKSVGYVSSLGDKQNESEKR